MPVYEYRCQSGHEFELRRGMSEFDSPASCPECGENGKRMASVFASQNSGVGIMVPAKPALRPTTAVQSLAKPEAAKSAAAGKPKQVKEQAVVKQTPAKPKLTSAIKGKA